VKFEAVDNLTCTGKAKREGGCCLLLGTTRLWKNNKLAKVKGPDAKIQTLLILLPIELKIWSQWGTRRVAETGKRGVWLGYHMCSLSLDCLIIA
jgi:hypothetical protein